ncbi:TonB-dependent receptor [Azonexus fungiphilus]|nr:TonB-dependent receptor [Azonexus fungiphilus]
MNQRHTRLALLLPLAFANPLQAAEQLASLDTMVVTATRQPLRVNEVLSDISVIERSEIETAGHSSLEQILAAQPGIQLVTNGSWGANSLLLIRGTSAKHVLLLVDGMRVGSATSGEPTWSRLPVAQIERIEIIRGPASAMYGSDAIGGVIQVLPGTATNPCIFPPKPAPATTACVAAACTCPAARLAGTMARRYRTRPPTASTAARGQRLPTATRTVSATWPAPPASAIPSPLATK